MEAEMYIDPKIKKLNLLAKACANAQSNDFKALWYCKQWDGVRPFLIQAFMPMVIPEAKHDRTPTSKE